MVKYIFVTGGVVSGLGKGITASSIARLLKQRGYKVSMQKLDPYVNFDTGLMHPVEHGETYITADGGETDLDLGHYERFIDEDLTKTSAVTTGKIYAQVINNERAGKYKGATVQVIPHITNEIKRVIKKAPKDINADIAIIEIGGTVGDVESIPYVEAIRQMRYDLGEKNTFYIHNTLVPFLHTSNEHKTKPTQQSVSRLRSLGIQPDALVLRTHSKVDESIKDKVSMFTLIDSKNIILAPDAKIVYEIVNNFAAQGLDRVILKALDKKVKVRKTKDWDTLIANIKASRKKIKIVLVGKYRMLDAYLSVFESLKHAGYKYKTKVDVTLIYSGLVTEKNVKEKLKGYDGILVPGGFGSRGTKGKMIAINYARINKIPYLGICYGLQLAVVEYARNVLKLKNANSTELNPNTKYPIIDVIKGKTKTAKGGMLRMGAIESRIIPKTLTAKIYKGLKKYTERHRHKYEFTVDTYNKYYKGSDLVYGSVDIQGSLIETISLKNHPFFFAHQFHAEMQSRPTRPSPVFDAFVKASIKFKK